MPYQGRLPYTYKSPYNTTLDQGTQTVPSLAFLGDTNNGLFSPATDNVAITTNGSEKLRVTDVGNVGIGITNPDKKFIVYGSGGNFVSEFYNTNDAVNNNGVYIRTLNANSATYPLSVNSGTNGSNQLFLIRGDGNIGIGTTNPTSKLHVYNGDLELSGGYNLTWGGTFSGGNPTIWGNASNKTIRFAPDGNTTGLVALLGASSSYILGNVGIGTTNPQKKVHIYSSSPIRFEDQNRQWDTNIKDGKLVIGDNTASADRLAIDTSGNVGIGFTSPTTRLDVDGRIRGERYVGINSLTLNSYQTVNPASNVFLYSQGDDRDSWIYLDSADTGSNWGIYHRQINSTVSGLPGNSIGFIGGGSNILQSYISLSTGDAYVRGNVGIGITNPSYALHAKSTTSNAVAVIESTYGGDNVQLRFKGPNGEKWAIGNNVTTGGTGTNFDIFDLVSSAGRFRIGSTGNVGIGTIDPSTNLDIRGKQKIENNANAEGATLFLRNTSTGSTAYSVIRFSESQDIGLGADAYIHYFNTNWGSNGYWDAKSLASGTTNGNINFSVGGNNIFKIWTNSAPRLYVMGNGNVGIGTTDPVKFLDVRGEATFGAGITTSDLAWGKDTNQLVYTFSGVASGVNPADGCLALVTPNTNPSATRIGSLVFGNKVSGPATTANPGLKAGIECGTNTNVTNAADTGAILNFLTKPDNANFRSQMTLNSNGVLTKPYQPAFLAFRNTALSHPSGWQLISNDILTESYDVGPVYSTSTNGRFVAPVTGKYMFYAGGYSSSSTSGERYAFGVKINNSGSPDFIAGGNYSLLDSPLAAYQVVLHLNANDYVELYFFSAVATTLGTGSHPIYWGGYLLG